VFVFTGVAPARTHVWAEYTSALLLLLLLMLLTGFSRTLFLCHIPPTPVTDSPPVAEETFSVTEQCLVSPCLACHQPKCLKVDSIHDAAKVECWQTRVRGSLCCQ
jgi:hypothetical protein